MVGDVPPFVVHVDVKLGALGEFEARCGLVGFGSSEMGWGGGVRRERQDLPNVYAVCATEAYDCCAWSGFDEMVDFAVGH
ncbi:hypothetical protein ES702_01580 [subsurface metagenome]